MDNAITYCSPFSILVHNRTTLRRYYCPFLVKFKQGDFGIKQVTEVGVHPDHILLYKINGEWRPFHQFEIL